MSDDIIKRLREALAARPTPGPWAMQTVGTSCGVCHKVGPFPGKREGDVPRHACLYADYPSASNPADAEIEANARFIAACSPENIAALLDRLDKAERERERLRAALDIARDYVAANVAYLRQRYRGREQFGRVHEAEGDLAAIDAATAAESGKE